MSELVQQLLGEAEKRKYYASKTVRDAALRNLRTIEWFRYSVEQILEKDQAEGKWSPEVLGDEKFEQLQAEDPEFNNGEFSEAAEFDSREEAEEMAFKDGVSPVKFCKWMQGVQEWISKSPYESDVVMAAMHLYSEWDADTLTSIIDEYYKGHYEGAKEFAEAFMVDTGYLDAMPEHLRNYFDYEKYGRDLKYDHSVYEGHWFADH